MLPTCIAKWKWVLLFIILLLAATQEEIFHEALYSKYITPLFWREREISSKGVYNEHIIKPAFCSNDLSSCP